MLDYFQWEGDDDKTGGMIMTAQFGVPKTETIIAGSSSLHELKIFNKADGSVHSKVTGFSGPVVASHLDHAGKTLAIGCKTGGTVLLHHGKE